MKETLNMNKCNFPAMSLIVITPDRYETIRKLMRGLRAQTIKEKLEIVIVSPSIHTLDLDESQLQGFWGFCLVEFGPIQSSAGARATGIRKASAPIVAFTEDHSYPDPHWAEALLKSHEQPWAAVGPVIRNANPKSLISWTNLLIEYGPWLEPASSGIMEHLPGHNSSYKRMILLDYGSELENLLEAETLLHWDLKRKGYNLYLESEAKTSHLNFSSTFSWLTLRFHCGRLFAEFRRRNGRWSLPKRFFYIGAAPLIPLVRLRRTWKELKRPGRQQLHLLPRILPFLILGLILDGMGEMVGYAFSLGNAKKKIYQLDFHRYRYLSKKDRKAERESLSLD